MKIVLLGSGNVATHLGNAFSNAKHTVLQVWSRNLHHAQALALEVQAEAIDQLEQVDTTADLYIVSVVDDAIIDVLEGLKGVSAPIIHTSGSTSIEVAAPYAAAYGVFYPLQTFSKQVPLLLDKTPILIEGSTVAVFEKLEQLASSISSHVQYCSSEQRITLHIAAVFACNFTNHFYAIAQQLLHEKDLNFELIRPLILETAQKVMDHLPTETQTGPAVRGDQLTMGRHVDQLKDKPDLLDIYTLLSERIGHKK